MFRIRLMERVGRKTWKTWVGKTPCATRVSGSCIKANNLFLVTRSSDGQMLFLANMASKMNDDTPLGSRIAEVHNGSSLFTGDAGQGESNIRRWLIENDWLEAIVALPFNLYNTGIATYIWVLTNRKPDHRKGKVQLIDATHWFKLLPQKPRQEKLRTRPSTTSSASATLTLPSRKRRSRRSAPTRRSVTGRSPSNAAPAAQHASSRPSSPLCFASGDEDLRARYTTSSATSSAISPASPPPSRHGSPIGATVTTRMKPGTTHPPARGCPKKAEAARPDETWDRDARLVDTATALRQELGGDLFTDHNVFRERVEDDEEARPQTLNSRSQAHPPLGELACRNRPTRHRQNTQTGQGQQGRDHSSRPAARPPPPAPSDGGEGWGEGNRSPSLNNEPDPDLRDTEQIPLPGFHPSGNPGGVPLDVPL